MREGAQWQQARSALSKMWEAMVDPDITVRHSAGRRACETSAKWQQAVISYNTGVRHIFGDSSWNHTSSATERKACKTGLPMSPRTGRELDYWDF